MYARSNSADLADGIGSSGENLLSAAVADAGPGRCCGHRCPSDPAQALGRFQPSTILAGVRASVNAADQDVKGGGQLCFADENRMSAAATTVRVMANFAVRLVHGPHWDPARPIRGQDAWDEHAAFMDGLARDGFIILGGPVGDGEQTLHAVEAADEIEIRARLAQDPWSSAGLLQIGTIEPWAFWLDSRPAQSAR